jgi:hypothetical protein
VDRRADVEGKAAAITGKTYGVWGKSNSIAGIGVFGKASATSGAPPA